MLFDTGLSNLSIDTSPQARKTKAKLKELIQLNNKNRLA